MCSTHNSYPCYSALSYHRLSPSLHTFLLSISLVTISKFIGDAFTHPNWCQVMVNEISALQSNRT